jgi:4a-hydroxytetrahydrobiopterin dehydratase
MAKLTQSSVDKRLASLSEWTQMGDAIQRTYDFADFVQAMEFVKRVAVQAEEVQHHPDILIRWNKVTLTLSTHDAKGLTVKDFESAKAYDDMYGGG